MKLICSTYGARASSSLGCYELRNESPNNTPGQFFIEDTSNATALIQLLKRESMLPIIPINVVPCFVFRIGIPLRELRARALGQVTHAAI